jgi:hypothetical protein
MKLFAVKANQVQSSVGMFVLLHFLQGLFFEHTHQAAHGPAVAANEDLLLGADFNVIHKYLHPMGQFCGTFPLLEASIEVADLPLSDSCPGSS